MTNFADLEEWLQHSSARERFYAGTFWFVFSALGDSLRAKFRGEACSGQPGVPDADWCITSSLRKRDGGTEETRFWHIPIQDSNIHVLFAPKKPSQALRSMYSLLSRARGKAHLFPLGHTLTRQCARLGGTQSYEDTYIVRGVSYPSKPNEGGADINLRPGNSAVFFQHLEDERRVLKTARMRVGVGPGSYTEFTVGRIGYIAYHKGPSSCVVTLATSVLPLRMAESAKPFEDSRGRFVSFRFSEPFFADRGSYRSVLAALSRLPRTSVAVLHANPYFYATVTNYEDGGEFDVFVTGHSSIHVCGRGDQSAASFIRLQEGLSEQFRDATIAVESRPSSCSIRDLLGGRL